MIVLSAEDRALLKTLLVNAITEVDQAAQSDAIVQPDDPMALMGSYDRAKRILVALTACDSSGGANENESRDRRER